jgi:hypothetical protein
MTTELGVTPLRTTTDQLPPKPVLEPNQRVFVKPNFESLNQAVFGPAPTAEPGRKSASLDWASVALTQTTQEPILPTTLPRALRPLPSLPTRGTRRGPNERVRLTQVTASA